MGINRFTYNLTGRGVGLFTFDFPDRFRHHDEGVNAERLNNYLGRVSQKQQRKNSSQGPVQADLAALRKCLMDIVGASLTDFKATTSRSDGATVGLLGNDQRLLRNYGEDSYGMGGSMFSLTHMEGGYIDAEALGSPILEYSFTVRTSTRYTTAQITKIANKRIMAANPTVSRAELQRQGLLYPPNSIGGLADPSNPQQHLMGRNLSASDILLGQIHELGQPR